MIELEVIRSGEIKDIYAIKEKGKCPCRDYMDSLDEGTLIKLEAVMETMATRGRVANTQKYNPLRDGIYEFKAKKARVFCFHHGNSVICTHGVDKPKPKQLEVQLKKAKKKRSQFLSERR